MKEEKELVVHFGVLTFLTTLLGVSIYRMKKGLDNNQIFSIFWTYSGINYIVKYRKSKKRYDIVMVFLSFANAILLTLLQCKKEEKM